jgi:spore coat polysaccharide biosynthesis protein SpsF (cytidylyltransferase family)
VELKTVLITQARTGSTRLPGKVLMEINQTPLLKIHLDRLKKSKNIDKIIVATTDCAEDNIIEKLATEWGYEVFRGSENDVLDRFYQAVKKINPIWVVRVTSDCPLIDPKLVDDIISFAQNINIDYCSNTLIENFPDGQDVEVFKFSALEYVWKNAVKSSDREHVTPLIRELANYKGGNIFTAINFDNNSDYAQIRMTVDEIRDYELMKIVIEKNGVEKSWEEYVEFIVSNKLNTINDTIVRNEGYFKSLKKD